MSEISSTEDNERPLRQLGLWSLIFYGLNCVVGSGIFVTPGEVAQALGPWSGGAFLLGGLITLPVGLCFALLSTAETESGGAARYTLRAFGALPGFLVGWVMWLSGVIGGASVAVAFGELLTQAYPNLSSLGLSAKGLAAGLIIVLGLINVTGCRQGATSNNLLSLLKIVMLAVFIAYMVPHSWALAAPDPRPWDGHLQWSSGLLAIVFTFSGFEEIPLPASEARQPQRDVPWAVVVVLGISSLLYFVVQTLVYRGGGAGQAGALAYICASHPWLSGLIILAGLASTLSVNTSIAFSCPRSLWTLADSGQLTPWLGHLNSGGVPSRCIIITASLTLVLAISNSLQALLLLSVLAAVVQHLAASLSCWRLRAELVNSSQRPVWQVQAVSLFSIAVCLFLLAQSQRDHFLGLVTALVVGLLIRGLLPPKVLQNAGNRKADIC